MNDLHIQEENRGSLPSEISMLSTPINHNSYIQYRIYYYIQFHSMDLWTKGDPESSPLLTMPFYSTIAITAHVYKFHPSLV